MASAAGIQVVLDGNVVTLNDVQEDAWYGPSVKAAVQAGVVSGYRNAKGTPTGVFGPADKVTIGQAMKMTIEASGAEPPPAACPTCDWSHPYFVFASSHEFVISDEARTGKSATRAEVAQMIMDAFKLSDPMDLQNLSDYTDVLDENAYAKAIEVLTHDDIMVGDGRTKHCGTDWNCQKTTFRPMATINRAETAAIVMRARTAYGTPWENDTMGPGEEPAGTVMITYTDAGFAPSSVNIAKNTVVIFKNKSSSPLQIASDPHPSHTDLPALNAATATNANEEYRYQYAHDGAWGFHNHLQPTHKGTVIVQ